MNSIEGVEKVEQAIGKWSPRDLAIIEDIELKSASGQQGATLIIKALFQRRMDSWPDFDKEMLRVTIVFDDVGSLRLKDFGGRSVQIMGFDIHYIGDRGLEGINYEIEDYEDDRIRFICGSIRIQSIKPAVNAFASPN